MSRKNVINAHCGKIIREKRKYLNYSQDELASAVGLTRPSICNIENGKQGITVETLLKLCAIFKCNATYILPPIPAVSFREGKPFKKVIESKRIHATYEW